MRIDVMPQHTDAVPGQPAPFTLTVANTSSVIGGYVVRVLGADPGWVQLDASEISLFPDESRTIPFTVTPPEGIMAGTRRIAVQVRELTPPGATSVIELDVAIPSTPSVQLRVDPLTVTAGRSAAFSLLVANTGNTQVERRLGGDDPEQRVSFRFAPAVVSLAPGEHAVVDLRASARRSILGSPAVRSLALYLDPLEQQDDEQSARVERETKAQATFIQRPLLSRGGLSLLGLLAAVTVFGLVITLALSQLVGQSAADRDLALQVSAARNATAATGTAGASGTARLLTSGKPVAGVSVAVYSTDNTTSPLASTATSDKGTYRLPNLPAGTYKLSFRGAGFVQLWYPGTTNDSDATEVRLAAGQQRAGLDVSLGGVPATISGTVTGDDVSAATLYLETAPTGPALVPGAGDLFTTDTSAIVKTVPVGADGTFALADVPSPSIYQIRVVKPGYATSVQRIDIGAGETRKGVQIALRKGDGLVSGTVTSPAGPLGGVTITATAGQSTANTVSLTEGSVGTFTLRSLPTPAAVTLVASKAGYASQTLTLTLAAGQKLTGVSITLVQSSGAMEGTVHLVDGNAPAPGVSVTVTDGSLTVTSQTESSGRVGFWHIGGLGVPGTYTMTFARPDLVSQTVSVSLDGAGNITPGSFGAQISGTGISVSMQSAWASVAGTVKQHTSATGTGDRPVGEAVVTLTSGSTMYTTTTASTPEQSQGAFRLENLPPGTYTVSVSQRGTSPTSTIMTLRAGQAAAYNPVLETAASITGRVVGTDHQVVRAGWTVELYVASQYPAIITASTKTDSTGRFTFPAVDAPQAYVIVVRPTSASAQAATRTVQIDPSEQLGSATDTNPKYANLLIEADTDG
jgi:5-hydroxyisourate hydrolase-like protein (transthyretin family)